MNDKRKSLGILPVTLPDSTTVPVHLYRKTSGRRLSVRLCYGVVDCYLLPGHTENQVRKFLQVVLSQRKGYYLDRPFYKEGEYLYVLGTRKKIAFGGKDSEDVFALRANAKDPLVRYRKLFQNYLEERVPVLAERMGLDVKGFRFRTGLFLSYYGSCFPKKKQIKFDYRLFAYRKDIIDSVIFHELCHLFETHHNDRFYRLLYLYCPDYDRMQDFLVRGFFQGEE